MEIGSNTNIESDYLILGLKRDMCMFGCFFVYTDFTGPLGKENITESQ